MKRPSHRRPGGFTLVELLVVVAIIVILAALALVLIPTMRARALVATDTQRLREIATGLGGYASEHNMSLPNQHDPIPDTDAGSGNRWNFHECVDRYLGTPPPGFNPSSIYNHLRRTDSPFFTKAARAYPGFKPSYKEQPSPVAFGFNPNINHGTNWRGRLSAVPNPAATVVVTEYNRTGSNVDPAQKAVFDDDVECRYRVSRPGGNALYLFADFHVESLHGDRGYQYYEAHKDEANIWRWW